MVTRNRLGQDYISTLSPMSKCNPIELVLQKLLAASTSWLCCSRTRPRTSKVTTKLILVLSMDDGLWILPAGVLYDWWWWVERKACCMFNRREQCYCAWNRQLLSDFDQSYPLRDRNYSFGWVLPKPLQQGKRHWVITVYWHAMKIKQNCLLNVH